MIKKYKEFSENKTSDFIKKIGDFFYIMCPECDKKGIKTRMKKDYSFTSCGMCGPGDSMHWVCPVCNHKEGMPDTI